MAYVMHSPDQISALWVPWTRTSQISHSFSRGEVQVGHRRKSWMCLTQCGASHLCGEGNKSSFSAWKQEEVQEDDLSPPVPPPSCLPSRGRESLRVEAGGEPVDWAGGRRCAGRGNASAQRESGPGWRFPTVDYTTCVSGSTPKGRGNEETYLMERRAICCLHQEWNED
ncbi:uncharacterized protein LOC128627723 isoform X2 [Artibeus jamaicensis]|uniref:uncharacterized protein LOC128627723 isoform X2 n=1 Tax=Artibeus jamaicensis TaxID=9417 RepID=UPI00235AD7A4|nr:uncharacterized protein LOC128627723 isoform X2 [Artibeus jamaicensis]